MEFPIEAVTRTRSLSTPQAGSLGPHCHGRHLDHNFKLSPRFQARALSSSLPFLIKLS